jgi:catechol 2,3-dioxygenase-like lactoylglutathione lyase family enzyme
MGLLLAASGSPATSSAAQGAAVVRGLDHIPLAVRDLERSKADFEALGFTLKPGRLHENGLRNAHAKFPDGTELELITAPAATDALTSEYHRWLENGDGPAFLGLYTADFHTLGERLSRLGLALHRTGNLGTLTEPAALRRLFFARRQHSPTDRPQHFAHANTAFSLARVWLAGAEAEQQLLPMLGAAPMEATPCAPFGSASAAFLLPEGEIVFLPAAAQLAPGRPIVAATVKVSSLETARNILRGNRIQYHLPRSCTRNSCWIGPADAHGLWLEFWQPSASR